VHFVHNTCHQFLISRLSKTKTFIYFYFFFIVIGLKSRRVVERTECMKFPNFRVMFAVVSYCNTENTPFKFLHLMAVALSDVSPSNELLPQFKEDRAGFSSHGPFSTRPRNADSLGVSRAMR